MLSRKLNKKHIFKELNAYTALSVRKEAKGFRRSLLDFAAKICFQKLRVRAKRSQPFLKSELSSGMKQCSMERRMLTSAVQGCKPGGLRG